MNIDVFLIAGQSNAMGMGSSSLSPLVPTGKVLQYYGGTISDANDPVGNANTGSAWPSFGITYNMATGRNVCFIPAAVPGSAQSSSVSSSNWDLTGSLYDAATAALSAGMDALTNAGWTPVFKGVLWDQGETDGGAIYNATVSSATVKTALLNMIARFRSETLDGVPQTYMPFYILRVGANIPDTYAAMRQLQDEVAAGDPYVRVVFRDSVNFPYLGYINTDNVHYTQPGLNYMGSIAASNIISGRNDDSFHRSPDGGVYYSDGPVSALNTTQSTSTTTGALIVAGGAAIKKWLNVGGKLVTAPSATGRAGLNIPPGVAPTVPVDGDTWNDGTHIKARVNGVTVTEA